MAFGEAVTTGQIEPIAQLLREDAVLVADGGGKVLAALNPIRGATRIARFFVGAAKKFAPQTSDLRSGVMSINGGPGIVVWRGTEIDQVMSIASDGTCIEAIYIVRNPDKLRALNLPAAILQQALC